jgi:hypothetical protein
LNRVLRAARWSGVRQQGLVLGLSRRRRRDPPQTLERRAPPALLILDELDLLPLLVQDAIHAP